MRGLAILSLTISHLRSHRATRLVLDGRPVALIGRNGAGKTNILEAVSMLSPGRGLRRAAGADLVQRPGIGGWKVSAEVFGISGQHAIETKSDGAEGRQVRIDGKIAPQTALGRVLRMLWLVPAMDRIWIEAAEGRRRFLDRMALSFFPDHAEAATGYERAMRDRNRLLKDEVTDAHWYAALEAQMARCGTAMMANRQATLRLLAAAQDGRSAFPNAVLSLLDPEPAGGDLAEALAVSRRRDMAAGRALVGPHRTDLLAVYAEKAVAADQCSTGEQKALLLSLILANARALAAEIGHAPVLLLDEVAAHLDEDRRAALYDEICAMGAQALMTGTDAGLFQTLGARAQIFAVREAGGLSSVAPLDGEGVSE